MRDRSLRHIRQIFQRGLQIINYRFEHCLKIFFWANPYLSGLPDLYFDVSALLELLTDNYSYRDSYQVGVFELYARRFVAIVPEYLVRGAEVGVYPFGHLQNLRLFAKLRYDDMEGSDRKGELHPGIIVPSFDNRRHQPFDPDAVAAHHHHVRLPGAVQVVYVH